MNGKIKEGDYFTVKYPQRVTVNGDVNYEKLNNQMKVKPLTNANGDVVANGIYDVNNKTVKYTFTNFVNDRNNIKGTSSCQFSQIERIRLIVVAIVVHLI